jgi:hypothetical protein
MAHQNHATLFSPGPVDAGAGIWVVSEFYNGDVPGYGAPSGITIWDLDDLTPVFCGEEIEQHDLIDPPGGFYRVGFALRSAEFISLHGNVDTDGAQKERTRRDLTKSGFEQHLHHLLGIKESGHRLCHIAIG